MPIAKYFKGDGEKVMRSMKKEYGDKEGKKVFYATANKQGNNPAGPSEKFKKKHKLHKSKKK